MTRFVVLSFVFLGWAFYEVSGGKEFEPEPPERPSAQTGAAAPAPDPRADDVDISAALAAESLPPPEPSPFSIVSPQIPTPEQERVTLMPAPDELVAARPAKAEPADIREVRGNRVNMRSGPGTQFGVLDTLTRGTRVEVLREADNGWVRLEVAETGRIGWMSGRLLRVPD